MKKILLILLIWVLFLASINKLSTKFLADQTSYELPKKNEVPFRFWIAPWLNFDGRNYLEIARRGYNPPKKGNTDLRVFFPLYPLLIRIFSLNLVINPVVVGLFISAAAFVGILFLLRKLAGNDKVIYLLFLFPTSFYLIAYYTESLFLLLVLLTFYFLNKKNLLLASIFTALATATRLSALALLPALFWEAHQVYRKSKKIPWPVILSPAGFIAFIIHVQQATGSGLAVISAHKNWDKPFGPLGIWYSLRDGLSKVITASDLTRYSSSVYFIEVIELIFAVFLILILIKSYKKIKFSYWLYMLFSSILIFFSGVLSGIHRYMLVIFPLYIYLAKALPRKYFYAVCFCSFILLVCLSALFLRGYWVA